jgi:hypothetical protein
MYKKRNCQKYCDPKVAEFIFKMFKKVSNKIKPTTMMMHTRIVTEITSKSNATMSHVKGGLMMIAQRRIEKIIKDFFDLFYYRRIY